MASLVIQTPPAAEPVDLGTVKNHLRVTIADDDALIGVYLQSARELIESESGRSLVNKVYRQSHDRFPQLHEWSDFGTGYYYAAPRYSRRHHGHRQAIKLLRSPLVSVTKITYIGLDQLQHDLLPATDFLVDSDSEPPRLMPLWSQVWPLTLRVPNAVQVFFTAGYGDDGANVPATLKVAILNCVAMSNEFREPVTLAQVKNLDWFERLVWNERVLDYAPTR